jgi:hypothetical protein
MNANVPDSVAFKPPGHDVSRSQESLAIEAIWRALPKSGPLPERASFRPSLATRFLSNIVLIDADLKTPYLKVRLVGSGFESRIQRKIVGMNYLDFLLPQFHTGALAAIKLMSDQPCGLWQVMALHYERELAEPYEATCFPFAPTAEGKVPLLNFVRPLGHSIESTPTSGRAIMADTAMTFAFIDVGAGVPGWPPA